MSDRCDPRKKLTVQQAKSYYVREGPGRIMPRVLALSYADWKKAGRNVAMWNHDDSLTIFKCERGSITHQTTAYEDLPVSQRRYRQAQKQAKQS